MRLRWLALLLCLAGCLSPHIDPAPQPGPQPGPQPTPQPAPTPGPIRVLIVEETEDRTKPELRPWLGVFNSVKIRGYLNSHCVTENGQPAWRWLDKDADLTNAGTEWQQAMQLPRDSLPWIVISNGKTGTSGPLPQTEAAVLELLKKWGGE